MGMNKKKLVRTISPRLANGRPRARFWGRLPQAVKDGLRSIARDEKKSMSWVMEEVVIDYFSLDRPKYIVNRKDK